MFRTAIFIVWLLALISSSYAAQIVATPLDSSETGAISVEGEFLLSDVDEFRKAISQFTKALVILSSDGGSVVAGIRIGELIRLKNYSTMVPDGMRCASACAIAWLGGGKRLMAANAQIGFHAAFVVRSGQATEIGVGNALVGAYLNKIGLPDRAVVYITQAPPDSMTWLSLSEAQQKGIDVALYTPSKENAQTKVAPSVKPPAPRPAQKTATIPTARISAGQIVGRWGLAAYHKEIDRGRAAVAAQGQCRAPYVIAPGSSGGIMMHLADQGYPQEVHIKSGIGQRLYIGPPGAAGGEFDREILDFDGRVLILRWIDPGVASRYGIMVYVRCG